jgi:hypothetical protein
MTDLSFYDRAYQAVVAQIVQWSTDNRTLAEGAEAITLDVLAVIIPDIKPMLQAARQDVTIERIRKIGRECGYAVAVHGSRVRDLDLVAIPWVHDSTSVGHLLDKLLDAGFMYRDSEVELKPHRVAMPLFGGGGCEYVDLSIVYHGHLNGSCCCDSHDR